VRKKIIRPISGPEIGLLSIIDTIYYRYNRDSIETVEILSTIDTIY